MIHLPVSVIQILYQTESEVSVIYVWQEQLVQIVHLLFVGQVPIRLLSHRYTVLLHLVYQKWDGLVILIIWEVIPYVRLVMLVQIVQMIFAEWLVYLVQQELVTPMHLVFRAIVLVIRIVHRYHHRIRIHSLSQNRMEPASVQMDSVYDKY